MRVLKKIWNKWKAIVDEHNSHITYVDYDNAWGYDMLFYPIFYGIIVGVLFGIFELSIAAFIFGFLGMAIPLYIFAIIIPILMEHTENCAE